MTTPVATTARWRQVQALFHEVADLDAPARARLLAERCAGDPLLRVEVEELVAADAQTGGLLRGATGDVFGAIAAALLERPEMPSLEGRMLGPYTLKGLIGHGGMGAVYRAERADVPLTCAIKVVRGGLAAPETVRRFLLERRLLARLRHPNIATMLDAGVAEDGTPWLAMELIEGEPIDRYCDRHRLTLPQRLALFAQVCDAVAYAHASLVVHRDIKPGNILVTADGVPKLLDFGIAKLLDDADEPLTGTGLRLLTPEYAAPEQVAAEPITTATDVYALGLVLYELLSGTRAITLTMRTPEEIHRRLTATTIPRPSSAIARDAAAAAEAAAARGTDAAGLRRLLSGDLDAIVLRALAREPQRRYRSVVELAEDLARHRAGHPVHARPDTLRYRALSFVRRHRLRVAVAAAAAVTLVAFTIAMGLEQRETARALALAETEAAKARQVSDFLVGMIDVADPFSGNAVRADSVTLRDFLVARGQLVTRLDGQPAVQVEALNFVARMYVSLGLYDRAKPLFEQAHDVARRLGPRADGDRVRSWVGIGDLERARTRFADAERAYREALAIARPRGDSAALALVLNGLGDLLRQAGRNADAEPLLREALAIRIARNGHRHTQTADVKNNLGLLLWAKRDLEGAEPLLASALATHRELLPPVHPMTAATLNNLGLVRRARGDAAGAEAPLRESLEIKRQLFGAGHWRLANGQVNLASVLIELRRLAEAESLATEAQRALVAEFDGRHELIGVTHGHLARIAAARGDWRRAEREHRQALRTFERVLAPGHQRIATAKLALGRFLLARGRRAEAEPLVLAAYEAFLARDGAGHERTRGARAVLDSVRG